MMRVEFRIQAHHHCTGNTCDLVFFEHLLGLPYQHQYLEAASRGDGNVQDLDASFTGILMSPWRSFQLRLVAVTAVPLSHESRHCLDGGER